MGVSGQAADADWDAKIRAPSRQQGSKVRAATDLNGRKRTVGRLRVMVRYRVRARRDRASASSLVFVGRDQGWAGSGAHHRQKNTFTALNSAFGSY